jgi:RecB family exonuclease
MLSLLAHLAELTDAHPHRHKLLIGPTIAWGRELLGALARHRGGWIGWRATTLDALAHDLTYTAQATRRVRRVGALEQQMLLDGAVSTASMRAPLPDDIARALERTGARRALHGAITELRLAGVPSVDIADWPLGALLDRIRADYEASLRARALIDGADVLRWALDDSLAEWEWFADVQLVVGDLATLDGLQAGLRDVVLARGATVLRDEAVPPSHVRAFAAATPADELREVLRRTIESGASLDDLEIVATDDDSYAITLDTVCTALGIDSSMTRGVPIASTRIGRTLLEWLDALPDEADDRSPKSVAAELLLRLDTLDLPAESIDDRNRVRCADELRSVVFALDQPMPPDMARVVVRETIVGLRGLTLVTGVERPRFSGGVLRADAIVGRLHLTTLANAGLAGRRIIAVVGLDAERTRGPMIQSAVLPDHVRRSLSTSLPTTDMRRRARMTLVQQAIARAGAASDILLLSFSTASATTGREAGPSQALLDAMRALDDEIRDHDLLRTRLGQPIGAIPAARAVALDARDVWFQLLQQDGLLLDGAQLVTTTLDGLHAGLLREAANDDPAASAWHGMVPEARGHVDPRITGEAISPSSLETLGACGLRWFYGQLLRLERPAADADPDAWLDASSRGTILHRVYARIVRSGVMKNRGGSRDAAEAEAVRIVDQLLVRFRDELPPPSERAYTTAREQIADEARHFVRFEWAADAATVLATEQRFGARGDAVLLPLPDGSAVRLAGSIDRADALDDGSIRIIDYKTGSAWPTGGVPLDGGRRLQLPLYAAAASQLLQRAVSQAEYRFPTVRGGGEAVTMEAEDRDAAPHVVQALLDAVADGTFLPTDNANDCRWCDYQPICRVSVDRFGKTNSPRAAWAEAATAASGAVPRALLAQRARRTTND